MNQSDYFESIIAIFARIKSILSLYLSGSELNHCKILSSAYTAAVLA